MSDDLQFVEWFRQSAPYIRQHRGRTMVVVFGGEVMRSSGLRDLVGDVALLNSLGVRIVLVAGSRPQIERRLSDRGVASRMHEGLRVTDRAALAAAMEAAGTNRVELERLLSMGLPGSPMAGARVRVATGNFVTARPHGVIDGVDFGFTGRVRRIDHEAIRERLDRGAVVTLTPIGYSVTGECFNLSTPELAAETAVALNAEKLVSLVEGRGVIDGKGGIHTELDPASAREILGSKRRLAQDVRQHLAAATTAVERGVPRAHLIDRRESGGLLRELFTRDGIGTLVTSELYEGVRPARLNDVPSLLHILEPLEEEGVLVHRSRELLEEDIDNFVVVERDGLVLGCAALYPYEDGKGELACLGVRRDFQRYGRGEVLLRAIERRARDAKLTELYVLTTQSGHWFQERGFSPAKPKDLPPERKGYDRQRKSKVLRKLIA
ncbi:MAG: amino-acid N-acetyltransferase [Myxococcota bacterium]